MSTNLPPASGGTTSSVGPSGGTTPPVEITPTPLTEREKFWLELGETSVKQSIPSLEDAAKQLIAIVTLAQTIYFAAISFSDVRRGFLTLDPIQQWAFVIAFLLPVALWIGSLWCAILVFRPRKYATNLDSPQVARDTFYKIVKYKHSQLQLAYLFLAAGFVPLLVDIFIYLVWFPVVPKP